MADIGVAPSRAGRRAVFPSSVSPGPIVVVVPVVDRARAAGLAVRRAGPTLTGVVKDRPVWILVVDGSADHDARVSRAVHDPGGYSICDLLAMPGARWGEMVTAGLGHAQRIGASVAVLLDPDFMAGQDEPEDLRPEAALGQAVSEVLRQRRPGVVCVPVMVPWWQRLLAMHVLRPLCAPALGFPPVDPAARTLVLSPAAVAAALSPRWGVTRLGWQEGHGLGVLAAARHADLDVVQVPPARFDRDRPPPGSFVPERALAIELIRAALCLASASPAGEGRAIASWVEDHSLDAAVPGRVLAQIWADCEESAGIAPCGDAAGWPGPLIDAWHAARGGSPHLGLLAQRVWLAYVARLRAWLRTTRSGLTGVARETVRAASIQFLAATGARVEPDAESPP